MKSISDIKKDLINSLESQESGAWARVNQSLVGKELIAFGAEVISASYNIVDSFVKAFDYKTADERSLISMSHVYDVPVSFVSPAYIRIRLNNKANLSFKPFELTYSVGNVKFTNVSFFKGNDDIVLYQGIVKTSKSTQDSISDFVYDKETPWNKVTIPTGSDEIMTGVNIGKAMPESVYVFFKEDYSQGLLSQFNPIRASEYIPAYKIYTLMNRDQMIKFGDGVWGKKMSNPALQIIWLEPTTFNFALNGKLSSSLKGELSFTVSGSGAAKEMSLDYARDVFRRHLLELNAVVSKDQIHDFVNSFSYIEDCSVTAKNDVVTVYVKPTDPSDNGEYGSIQAELDLKGGLFTSHEVKKGNPVSFKIQIETNSETVQRSQIEEYLLQAYGYHSVGFSKQVDCNEIAADLFTRFGLYSRVLFGVTNTIVSSGSRLQFVPIAGTIKILNSFGKVVGYDLNGQLFCEVDAGSDSLELSTGLNSNMGGFNINYVNNSIDMFSEGYLKRYPSEAIASVFNKLSSSLEGINSYAHNGHVYVYKNDGTYGASLCVYTIDQISPQGLTSSIVPISGATPKTIISLEEGSIIPIYINGNYYCINHNIGTGELQLQFYSGSSYSPYFSINIPSIKDRILGLFIQNNNIYVVCTNNNVVVISNFNSSYVGWTTLRMSVPVEGTVIQGFHAYDKGRCALLLSDGSIWRSSGLSTIDNSVQVQNQEKITSLSPMPEGKKFIYCSSDSVWVGNIGESQDKNRSVVVYDSGETFDQLKETYPVYKSTTTPIGTVNYLNGEIVYGESQLTGLSYQSTVVDLDEKSYLKLDDATPVLWN